MLLADSAADVPGWVQGGAVGVVCSIVILLLAKTIPKSREDERSDKVAVALAASTLAASTATAVTDAMALIVQQNKEQSERHTNAMHKLRDEWHAERLVNMTLTIGLEKTIAELRHEINALRSQKSEAV